jgi:trehalose 6-phosphate synthase/phosphatase
MRTAIAMAPAERQARMKALRGRIVQFDASVWVQKFVEFFHGAGDELAPCQYDRPHDILSQVPRASRFVLFLDYDGTLFPIVRIPQLASPDQPLLALLKQLAGNQMFEVHIVSGRSRDVMDEWFGGAGIHLHAEHGAMSRAAGEASWTTAVTRGAGQDWQSFVRSVLKDFTKNTPGSFIEEKSHSLAWHYRMADPVHGERVANELRLHGRETFAPMGLELIPGKRVIEIRHVGINKGLVVSRTMEHYGPETAAIIIGDDVTDEDMFSAAPPGSLTIAVGDTSSRAQLRLRDPAAVRRFLELLASPADRTGTGREKGEEQQ